MSAMALAQTRRPVKGRIPSAGGRPSVDNARAAYEKHLDKAVRFTVQTPGGRRRKKYIKKTEARTLRELLAAVVEKLR